MNRSTMLTQNKVSQIKCILYFVFDFYLCLQMQIQIQDGILNLYSSLLLLFAKDQRERMTVLRLSSYFVFVPQIGPTATANRRQPFHWIFFVFLYLFVFSYLFVFLYLLVFLYLFVFVIQIVFVFVSWIGPTTTANLQRF